MALEAFRVFSSNIGFDLPKTEQVTSIETWDTCVYLGTKSGTVYQYVREHITPVSLQSNMMNNNTNSNSTTNIIDDDNQSQTETYQSMSRAQVSKKPIQMLKAIPALNLLVIHTDAKLCFFDLKTLKKSSKVSEIFYVGLFAIDPNTYQLAMHVKGKKKLYLYNWNSTKENYDYNKEIILPHHPLALHWVSGRLCMGIQDNYILINPIDSKIFPLSFSLDHFPLMTNVTTEICVFTSEVGIYITPTGEPSTRPPIVFSSPPQCLITVNDQHIIGVTDGVLEVISTFESKAVQCPSLDMICDLHPSNTLPSINPINTSNPTASSILYDGHQPLLPLIACHNTTVVVYLPEQNHILTLHTVPAEIQIKQYLNKLLIDEAEALLHTKSPSLREIEDFHIQAGLELIQALQFHRAFIHFTTAKVSPSQLLFSLFPHLLTLPIGVHPTDQLLFESTLHSFLTFPTHHENNNNNDKNNKIKLNTNTNSNELLSFPSIIDSSLSTSLLSSQQRSSSTTTTMTTSRHISNLNTKNQNLILQPNHTQFTEILPNPIKITHQPLQNISILQLLSNGRDRYISQIYIEDFQDVDQLNSTQFKIDPKTNQPSHWPLSLSFTALYNLLLWFLLIFLSQQRTMYNQILLKHYKASTHRAKQQQQGYVMSDDYYQTNSNDQSIQNSFALSPPKLAATKQELVYIDNALLYLTILFTAVFNPHFNLKCENAYNIHTFSLLSYLYPFIEADGYTIEQWYNKTTFFFDMSLDLFHYNVVQLSNQQQQQQEQLLIDSQLTTSTSSTTNTTNNKENNNNTTNTTTQTKLPPPISFPLYLAQQALFLLPKKTRSLITFIQPTNTTTKIDQNKGTSKRRQQDENSNNNNNRFHDDPNLQLAIPIEGLNSIKLQAYPLPARRTQHSNNNNNNNDKSIEKVEKVEKIEKVEKNDKIIIATIPLDNENDDKDVLNPSDLSNLLLNAKTTASDKFHTSSSSLVSTPSENNDKSLQSSSTTTPTTNTSPNEKNNNTTILSHTTSTIAATSNLSTRKYLSYFPISIQSLLSTNYCTPIYYVILLSYFEQWYALSYFYLQRHILSQQILYSIQQNQQLLLQQQLLQSTQQNDTNGYLESPITSANEQFGSTRRPSMQQTTLPLTTTTSITNSIQTRTIDDLTPVDHPSTLTFLDGHLSPLLQALQLFYRISKLYDGPLYQQVEQPTFDLHSYREGLHNETITFLRQFVGKNNTTNQSTTTTTSNGNQLKVLQNNNTTSTSTTTQINSTIQLDSIFTCKTPRYSLFVHLNTKLFKTAIDIFEYEDNNNFIPNFYLSRRIPPPMGIMAYILRYKPSLFDDNNVIENNTNGDDDNSLDASKSNTNNNGQKKQQKIKTVTVHFQSNNKNNNTNNQKTQNNNYDDDDYQSDEDDDDDNDLLLSSPMNNTINNNNTNNNDLTLIDESPELLLDSDHHHSDDEDIAMLDRLLAEGQQDYNNKQDNKPQRKKKGSSGPMNSEYNTTESTTQEVILMGNQQPGQLVIFDYYPTHKHDTKQSASYREALANANASEHNRKGNNNGWGGALGGAIGGALKMSALKKTAQFLYNPFKRRQHWSQNGKKRPTVIKNASDDGNNNNTNQTNQENDNNQTMNNNGIVTNAMNSITNLSNLDVYQLHNTLSPDFINIQLAFDCYFLQQQQEYPLSNMLLQYYHSAHYQNSTPLLFAIQILENQPLWDVFYQFNDYLHKFATESSPTSSFYQYQPTSHVSSHYQQLQSQSQQNVTLSTILYSILIKQPARINNSYIPSTFKALQSGLVLHDTIITQQQLSPQNHNNNNNQSLLPTSSPSSPTSPSDQTTLYYTTLPPKSMQSYPPFDILQQYIPWSLSISPSLLIPLISSIWLTLLIDINSTTLISTKSNLGGGNTLATSPSLLVGNDTHSTRKIPRSKVLQQAETTLSSTTLSTSLSGNSNSPQNNINEKTNNKKNQGSMHVVINKKDTSNNDSNNNNDVHQEPIEMWLLQDLFQIVLKSDYNYRQSQGLGYEDNNNHTLETYVSKLQHYVTKQHTKENKDNNNGSQQQHYESFVSPSHPSPFRQTNRLINVYQSNHSLGQIDNLITTSIQTGQNYSRCQEQQSKLLNSITHVDQTTPPLFISVLTYLLHAVNVSNGFYPTPSNKPIDPRCPHHIQGFSNGNMVSVTPGLNQLSTTQYSLPNLFSILIPPELVQNTIYLDDISPKGGIGIMTHNGGNNNDAIGHKMTDLLLLMLIKQLRLLEMQTNLIAAQSGMNNNNHHIDNHTNDLLSSKSNTNNLSSSLSTISTPIKQYQYPLEELLQSAKSNTSSSTSSNDQNNNNNNNTNIGTDLITLDPTMYITRLNNMLIKSDDYLTLLQLLQNSFVTTITDIISSSLFYPTTTSSSTTITSPVNKTSSSNPSSTTPSTTTSPTNATTSIVQYNTVNNGKFGPKGSKYIDTRYGPSVDVILQAIRQDEISPSSTSTQQPTTTTITSSSSTTTASKVNSLHHCCLSLEARLGHHRDVITLYLFTLMDIDGALSYVRVVHQQQSQSQTTNTTTTTTTTTTNDNKNSKSISTQLTTTTTTPDELRPVFLLLLEIVISDAFKRHITDKCNKITQTQNQNNLSSSLSIAVQQLPQWEDIIEYIFSTHGQYLTPYLSQVIQMLPKSLPISTILPCLEQTLPTLQHTRQNAQILFHLTRKHTYANNNMHFTTMKKNYFLVTEPISGNNNDISTNTTSITNLRGNRQQQAQQQQQQQQAQQQQAQQQQNRDQVCVLCNKKFLDGTMTASIPFAFFLWLTTNYNDVFMFNQQNQKDTNLPPPLQRTGVVDFYKNNILLHYNCTTRIESYLTMWNRSK